MALAVVEFRAQDAAGNFLTDVDVTVREEVVGLPLAGQLYSDRDGTAALGNPTNFPDGIIRFYISEGAYRIDVSKDGVGVDSFHHKAVGTFAERDQPLAASEVTYDDGQSPAVLTNVQAAIDAAMVARSSTSVKEFGAVGDGIADDTAAILDAINTAGNAGGGNIYFPAGTYLVTNPLPPDVGTWDNDIALNIVHDNIHLVGDGRGATIIRLANGANCFVIKFGRRFSPATSVSDCSLSDLTIDGNRANQSAPTDTEDHWSGVDIASGCHRIHLKRLHIHDCQYYGASFQRQGFVDCIVDDVLIERTGADGIDAKNDTNLNFGNKFTNITVKEFGLASGLLTHQAGIDIYGGVHASNITVTNYGPVLGKVGIRFQSYNGEFVQSTNPSLDNFYCQADGSANTTGLRINAHSGSIATGQVKNCAVGVQINQRENKIIGVLADTCGDGFQLTSLGGITATPAERNNLSGCVARGCTGNGFNIAGDNENILIGCIARANGVGINIGAGSTSTQIIGGQSAANTTNLIDSGTSTVLQFVHGIGVSRNPNYFFAIAQSAVAVSHTGSTTETVLATITVPANTMGPNGVLRITTNWTATGTGGVKTPRVRFGGIGGTQYNPQQFSAAALESTRALAQIANRNATNSQVGSLSGAGGGGWSLGAANLQTGAIDTTVAQTIVLTGQLANSGDTITLHAYTVELLRA